MNLKNIFLLLLLLFLLVGGFYIYFSKTGVTTTKNTNTPTKTLSTEEEKKLKIADSVATMTANNLAQAINMFIAVKGYAPWLNSPSTNKTNGLVKINNNPDWIKITKNECTAFEKISKENAEKCNGYPALLNSYEEIFKNPDVRDYYVYNSGKNTYICFNPQTNSYDKDMRERCVDETGTGLLNDFEPEIAKQICAGYFNTNAVKYICSN